MSEYFKQTFPQFPWQPELLRTEIVNIENRYRARLFD